MVFRASVAAIVYFLTLLIPSAWAITTYQEVTVTVNGSQPTSMSPLSATVQDNLLSGATIVTINVTMSDSSAFNGTCSDADSTYTTIAAVSGGCQLKAQHNYGSGDDGTHSFNVTATENSHSLTQQFSLTINSSSNFACLIGPNTPQPPPSIATTIGWTCSYNMDPSNSFYQTLANWMDYPSGTVLSKQWHCQHGFTYGFIPCDTSHIFVTNDPIDGKQSIDFALLVPNDNNATYDSSLLEINTSDSNTQNNQSTNTWFLTWPQNVYIEAVWRVDYGGGSITTCTDGQTGSQFQCVSTDGTGPEGWDTYSAGNAGGGYEATFGEFYSPSNYFQQCGGGFNRNNNSFVGGPCVSKITNGYIVQDEMYTCPGQASGSNDCYICFLDALAAQGPGQNATCGAMGYPGNGFNMYGARRLLNFQIGNQNHGFNCTGCEFSHTTWPQQINHYIRSVHVWTCSAAFTNVPNLPVSDSQIGQPYSCPPPSSNGGTTAGTLTGPDANGFIYWH